MAKKKMGGLGKGLDSLFADLSDDTGSEASGSTLLLREIEPDPEQPRKRFDDDALNQLADSIVENGLLQPIAVRPKKVGPGYIIIAGERRWRAARLAGLVEVPVIIKDVTDEQAAALARLQSLQALYAAWPDAERIARKEDCTVNGNVLDYTVTYTVAADICG